MGEKGMRYLGVGGGVKKGCSREERPDRGRQQLWRGRRTEVGYSILGERRGAEGERGLTGQRSRPIYTEEVFIDRLNPI